MEQIRLTGGELYTGWVETVLFDGIAILGANGAFELEDSHLQWTRYAAWLPDDGYVSHLADVTDDEPEATDVTATLYALEDGTLYMEAEHRDPSMTDDGVYFDDDYGALVGHVDELQFWEVDLGMLAPKGDYADHTRGVLLEDLDTGLTSFLSLDEYADWEPNRRLGRLPVGRP